MAETFYTILTTVGRAKLANAQVTGQQVEFKQMALGDGSGSYYNPVETQTGLRHEVWRGNVNQVSIDPDNPSWIIVETVILANVGGFTVREAGVFDAAGDMIAIGKFPETFKPILDDGSAKDLYIRLIFEVTNASSVTLKIDPSAIFATKQYVDQKVAGVTIPDASLTVKGKVQLSNATDSAAEDRAATPKAVKSAYDAAEIAWMKADQAFQLGNERKAEVVAALVALGVSASTDDSWDTLINKMSTVIKATGNAAVGDVLTGKTFSNASAAGLTGTMPNQGAKAITPGPANQTIEAGYHNGSGYVKGDPNLVAGNFPNDINIFGIIGLLERMTTAEKQGIATAITGKGVAASVNDSNTALANKITQIPGKKFATGVTMPDRFGNFSITGLAFVPNVLYFCTLNGYNYGLCVKTFPSPSANISTTLYSYNVGVISDSTHIVYGSNSITNIGTNLGVDRQENIYWMVTE